MSKKLLADIDVYRFHRGEVTPAQSPFGRAGWLKRGEQQWTPMNEVRAVLRAQRREALEEARKQKKLANRERDTWIYQQVVRQMNGTVADEIPQKD